MNKRIVNWRFLIAVIALVTAGVFVWQYATRNDDNGWKTYRSKELGFQMKYPPTWTIVEQGGDSGFSALSLLFRSQDYVEKASEEYLSAVRREEEPGLLQPTVIARGSQLEFSIIEIPSGFTWKDWAERNTDYPSGTLVSEGFLTREGREIFERKMEYGALFSSVVSFSSPTNARLFELHFHRLKENEQQDSELFRQVITSFSFSQ